MASPSLQCITGNVTPRDVVANPIVLVDQSPPRIDESYLQVTVQDDVKLFFYFARGPEIIRVNECDESGASGLPTSVACGRNAGIFSSAIKVARPSIAACAFTTEVVRSVEPSSTTIISRCRCVWLLTLLSCHRR